MNKPIPQDKELCEECQHCDTLASGACCYILDTGHTRGQIINGHIYYPPVCDKFTPRAGRREPGWIAESRNDKAGRPKQAYPEREKLYCQGLSDGQIAERLGIAKTTVFSWRQSRGLAPNGKVCELTDEENAARLKMYNEGYSDAQIAAACNTGVAAISRWRFRRGLKANKEVNERKRELYDAGLSDRDIANALGISANAVIKWRSDNGLPSNGGKAKTRPALPKRELLSFPERDRLYSEGYTDSEIATVTGVARSTICRWRLERGLRANRRREPVET